MKSFSIWLHINIPSRMYCSPDRWLHIERFAGLFFPLPLPPFLLPSSSATVFFFQLQGVLPPTILSLLPNLTLFLLRWVVKSPVRAAATPELSVKIFQNCQVFQFTMTVNYRPTHSYMLSIQHWAFWYSYLDMTYYEI